jgi:hypothetical protein
MTLSEVFKYYARKVTIVFLLSKDYSVRGDYLIVFIDVKDKIKSKQGTQNGEWTTTKSIDLAEVFDLSVSLGMRLHECDAHLEQARLYLAQERKEEAKPHVDDAHRLIEDTGYHRRDSALVELEEQVK